MGQSARLAARAGVRESRLKAGHPRGEAVLSRQETMRIRLGQRPKKPEVSACITRRMWYSFFQFSDGECSSVGRAADCGSAGRGFEPRHSPHSILFKNREFSMNSRFFSFAWRRYGKNRLSSELQLFGRSVKMSLYRAGSGRRRRRRLRPRSPRHCSPACGRPRRPASRTLANSCAGYCRCLRPRGADALGGDRCRRLRLLGRRQAREFQGHGRLAQRLPADQRACGAGPGRQAQEAPGAGRRGCGSPAQSRGRGAPDGGPRGRAHARAPFR